MLNHTKQARKQKEINQENEKLIGKLYEILTNRAHADRPYSANKKSTKLEPHEITRQIQLQARHIREDKKNREIGAANLQLLEAITTAESSHNPTALERDYVEKKRIADRLRMNTSPTAMHLLASPPVLMRRPKSAPKERPKSTSSLPTWYLTLANKMSGPEKDKSSRIHPYDNSKSSPTLPQSALSHPPFPASFSPPKTDKDNQPNQSSFEKWIHEKENEKNVKQREATENQQRNESVSLQIDTSELVKESTSASAFIPLSASPSNILQSIPRRVLLTEIDMRGVFITSPMSPSMNEKRQPKSPSSSNGNNSVPNPLFVVRVYDVGRVFREFKLDQSASSGLIVESKLLPETEKSKSYELFLPIKQLRFLVDQQTSSVYDSLGRKLRRLKCLDRDTGLYAELSNVLPASFLEQLCDVVIRNIETVIEPKGRGNNNEETDEERHNHRNYSVNIRLKTPN